VAKLKAHKRRRTRLRRAAVIALVVVALIVAAVGIVTMRIRAIALSMLRKQLPNCEVTLGRAVLNPLSKLSLYDLRIVDRSRPDAGSTIELQHVVARYRIASGLKLDIDLDVSRPTVVLDMGGEMPFPDLFARKTEKPSRFRLRACDVRDCRVTLDGPGYRLDATLDVQASGLGSDDAERPADVSLQVRDLALASGPAGPEGSAAAGSPSTPAEETGSTVQVGLIEGTLGYDATQREVLDRVLLRQLWARDCTVTVRYPDFRLSGTLDLALANETGDVHGRPTKLAISSDDFQLEAGTLLTRPTAVVVDADVRVQPDASVLTATGTLTAGGLRAALSGLLDKTGLHVTSLFQQQNALNLVELFVDDTKHHIPVIQDFPGLSGTVERFELALAYTPELGFGLTGAIVADGLTGTSDALMLTVKGMSVDTTFSLLPPERRAPLELVVGDPKAEAGPGRIVAEEVIWNAPGDMHFPATQATAHLWSEDRVWTLGSILGVIFESRGTGVIQALADGTVTLDLQFDGVNVAPLFAEITGKAQDQMTGHADAKVLITLKETGRGLGLHSVKASFHTKPPGGVLRLKEKEKSFNSMPGGDKVLEAVKQQMSPRFYDHFLEKFKNYQYESITIEASTEGNDYLLVVKIRDADKKNPLPIDLTIRYSRVYIYHDTPPPQVEGTQQ
jgi:hypothetical protein